MRPCLFLTLLVVSSLGQHVPEDKISSSEEATAISTKQLNAFLGALASNDKNTIASLFVSTFSTDSNIDQIVSQFQGTTVSVFDASFRSKQGVQSILKIEKGNASLHAFWFLIEDDASPTGWKVGGVGKPVSGRRFDFSDAIWCWADLLRCMGNTLALIFG
uniref:SnoaL-like domain-containing protein n=1 Tax=Caenorhabditis tropicalis TaxID=1561998 RepID=A0A1I7ULJ3_9PELO